MLPLRPAFFFRLNQLFFRNGEASEIFINCETTIFGSVCGLKIRIRFFTLRSGSATLGSPILHGLKIYIFKRLMFKGTMHQNKLGIPELLLHCSKCSQSCHPTCAGLHLDLLNYVTNYAWECTDCKMCMKCKVLTVSDYLLVLQQKNI